MRAEPGVAIDARHCECGARRNSCGTARTPPIGQCDDPSAEKRAPVRAIWGRVLRGDDERCMSLRRRVSRPGSLGARGVRQEHNARESGESRERCGCAGRAGLLRGGDYGLGARPDAGAEHETTTLHRCSAGRWCDATRVATRTSTPGAATGTRRVQRRPRSRLHPTDTFMGARVFFPHAERSSSARRGTRVPSAPCRGGRRSEQGVARDLTRSRDSR